MNMQPDCSAAFVLQATHIFDGLEEWPTHIMYLAGGELKVFEPASAFPELREGQLLELVERCDYMI